MNMQRLRWVSVLWTCALVAACGSSKAPAYAPLGGDESGSGDTSSAGTQSSASDAGVAKTKDAGTDGGSATAFTFHTLGDPALPPIMASGNGMSAAIKRDGSIVTWSTAGDAYSFPDKAGYVTLAANAGGVAATHKDGSVYLTGFFHGDTSIPFTYDNIFPGKKIVRLSFADEAFGCGLTAEGELHCWSIAFDRTTVDTSIPPLPRPVSRISLTHHVGVTWEAMFAIDQATKQIQFYTIEPTMFAKGWQLLATTPPSAGKFKELITSGFGAAVLPSKFQNSFGVLGMTEDGHIIDWDVQNKTVMADPDLTGKYVTAVDGCGVKSDGFLDCKAFATATMDQRFVYLTDDGARVYGLGDDKHLYMWGTNLGGTAMKPPTPDMFP